MCSDNVEGEQITSLFIFADTKGCSLKASNQISQLVKLSPMHEKIMNYNSVFIILIDLLLSNSYGIIPLFKGGTFFEKNFKE